MSLINQVLKDLDAREPLKSDSHSASVGGVNTSFQETDTPTHRTDWIRLATWTITGFLVVIYLGYLFLNQNLPDNRAIQAQSATLLPATNKSSQGQSSVVVEAPIKTVEPLVTVSIETPDIEPKVAVKETIAYLPLIDSKMIPETKKQPKEVTIKLKPKPIPKEVSQVVVTPSRSTLSMIKGLIAEGRLTEAQISLKKALKTKPSNIALRELMISLLLRSGREQEASEQIDQALSYAPLKEDLILLKARGLLIEQKQTEVISLLEKQMANKKAGVKTLAMLAPLYQQTSAFDSSVNAYKQLVTLSPNEASYWAGLAIGLEAVSNPVQAKQAYGQALKVGGLSSSLREYAVKRIQQLSLASDN